MSCKVVLLLLFSVLSLSPSFGQTAPSRQTQAELHLRLAEKYITQQRPDLAIPELQKVVALDPENMEAHGNLGVLLYFRGDFSGAAPQLRAAVQTNPGLSKIQALLGLAEGHLGNASSSRQDLEAAFPMLQDEKIKIQVGNALIENYTAAGDLEKAANTASTMLASEPTDTSVLYTAYRLYSDLADKEMLTLVMTAPGSAQTHEVMARQLARQGNEGAAIANYRDAIRLDPQQAGVRTEFAELLYSSTDAAVRAQAENEFKAALALNPSDEKALLMLGVIAAKRGDQVAAYADDSQAVKLQENDGDACIELAKILLYRNQLEKAQQLLERAVQVDPSNDLAHYLLGTLYRRRGEMPEAQEQVELYKRYKDLHDKLQKTFLDLRFPSTQSPVSGNESASK